MTRCRHGALLPVVVILLLGACADGYPDKTEVVTLHYGMAQAEAIKAMNQIVHGKQQKSAARFDMLEGCVLEMHARRPADGRESRTLPLKGSRAATAKSPDRDGYRVTLHRSGFDDPGQTVLQDIPWTEATQMKWLLDYLQSTC